MEMQRTPRHTAANGRRVLLSGVLALLLAVLLVACGGSSALPTPAPVPVAPAAAGSAGGPVARITTVIAPGGAPGAGVANGVGIGKGQGSGVHPSKGVCPSDHPVKGRRDKGQRVYAVAGSASYEQTKPEACFATEADAQVAGYHAA